MKKIAIKVIVPILALLMLLCMASSVKAGVIPPPTKTPITAVITGFTGWDTTAKYVVKDGIEYLLYWSFWGTIAIYAGTWTYTTLPSTPIATVSWVDVCWGTYNIGTNLGSYVFYEVWTLPGTFVGFDHPHSVGDLLTSFGITDYKPLTAVEGHIIVVGTGACAGQVINLATPDLEVTPFTGYWLTP